jgi:hypothetical protein
MPGPTERTSRSPVGTSPERRGRMTASQMTWVPVSIRASTRSCGKAPAPRPAVWRPKARSFSGVSATSSVVPSIAIRRSPPRNAPCVRAVAIGRATAWNSSRSSRAPARCRAWTMAAVLGTCHPVAALAAPSRQPATTSARTCRIDSAAHNPIATTSVTTSWVGSRRRRRSRVPVASMVASTV